ncbi:MAG: pilin [Candidatus Colwellbacteria bacterium]|nr:pilin [Candidatus Colwellbacteria bacterium]
MRQMFLLKNLAVTIFVASLIILSFPVHANIWSDLSVDALSSYFVDRQGVFIYDESTGNGVFTAQDLSVSSIRDTYDSNQLQNDSLDAIFLNTTADVFIYWDDGYQEASVEIKYNEEADSLQCAFQFFIRDEGTIDADRGNIKTLNCTDSPMGDPISSFTVEGEKVYAIDLGKMCAMDENGDGEGCEDNWSERASSFRITGVGGTDTPLGAGTGATESLVPVEVEIGLSQKIQNLYTWAVSLAGLVALGLIIFGGVLYAASAGNPSRITEAKTWITHALLGLFMLLGAYLVLGFINPDLTKLDEIFLAQNVNPQSQGMEWGGGGPSDECIGKGQKALQESIQATRNNVDCDGRYSSEETVVGGVRQATLLARAGNFGDHPSCNRVGNLRRDQSMMANYCSGYTNPEKISECLGIQYMTNFIGSIQRIMRSELLQFKPDVTCELCCDSEVQALVQAMTAVAGCETHGYNPNDILLPQDYDYDPDEIDQCTGAWGLFQMGYEGNPDQAGEYDVGNVQWDDQVRNAVNYLMRVTENYWECWGETHQLALDSMLGLCRCQITEPNWCQQSDKCNPPVRERDENGEMHWRKKGVAEICGIQDSPGGTTPSSNQPQSF